jgi:cell fate regulator YaaT (PSP1 superfamily)
MAAIYYVRLGVLGQIGRFVSDVCETVARGRRVVCRTSRGLEVGEVLGVQTRQGGESKADGHLLRSMAPEDELLLERLERNRERAFSACADRLQQRGLRATLVDVEHLFDGRSLYFYFLGEVTPEVEALTTELADVYAARAEFRRFSDTLTEGCGPGCGTQWAPGCGSDCSNCSLANACRAH